MPLRGEAFDVDLARSLQKPRPRILNKRDDAREAEREKRAVYAEIDARDQKRCRVCGRKGNPYATTALGKIHRAHIQDASRGGPLSAANLFSACWICHAFIHAKQLFVIGTNADKRLTFEIDERAVLDVFGTKELPKHVRIVAPCAEGGERVDGDESPPD